MTGLTVMSKARAKEFFKDDVLPHVFAFYKQRKIDGVIEQFREAGANLIIPSDKGVDLDAFDEMLKDYQDKENDRRKVIDDKAKAALFVVTLSITVMLAGLNFIKDGKTSFGYPLLFLILSGVLYLASSGITAVKAINISRFHVIHPDEWVGEDGRTVVGFHRRTRIKFLYAAVKVNELILTVKTNYVAATFVGIRNGILLLSLAFIIAVGNVGNQVRVSEAQKDGSPVRTGPGGSEQGQPLTPAPPVAAPQGTPASNANQPEADGSRDATEAENESKAGPGGERRPKADRGTNTREEKKMRSKR